MKKETAAKVNDDPDYNKVQDHYKKQQQQKSPEELAKAKHLAQLETDKVIQAYKDVFSTDQGQLVLKHIKKECSYGQHVFNLNPKVTAYNLGRQSIAIDIVDLVNTKVKG